MIEYKEYTQLLVPDYGDDNYEVVDLTELLLAESSLGDAPRHFITQRGVYQHGSTPIGMRYDERVIQTVIAKDLPNRVRKWVDQFQRHTEFNLSHNFDNLGNVTPCIYRKIIMGGDYRWRSDLVTTVGSTEVTSTTAKFADWGVQEGSILEITSGADIGAFVVDECVNENTLMLQTAPTSTATGVEYRVRMGPIIRDISVLLESGPQFPDDRKEWSRGYNEVLRFIAHYPLWFNPLRQRIDASIDLGDNLIFYGDPGYTDRAELPWWFGSDEIYDSLAVTYVGTFYARPSFQITGPFTNVEVDNISTGHTITFAYTAASGEQVTIDLQALKAYNSEAVNLTQYLGGDQILFGLYPHPIVEDGDNDIRIYITDGIEDVTQASMYWYAWYDGI